MDTNKRRELMDSKRYFSCLLDTLIDIEGVPECYLDTPVDVSEPSLTWRVLREKIKVLIRDLGRDVRY
jgi:hypothetical protein